jgi:hypothetical protein
MVVLKNRYVKQELYFKGNYRPYRMVYKVFAHAAVKKMGNALAAVGTDANKVSINAVGKMQYAFFYIHIIINVACIAVLYRKT